MRRLLASLLILCAALALNAVAPAPARADTAQEENEQVSSVRNGTQLIGERLALAAGARSAGHCLAWESILGMVGEDLDFYRRFHLAHPADSRLTDQMLDDAQRWLNIESHRHCDPNDDEVAFNQAYSALPKLIGTVQPAKSDLPPGASFNDRKSEVETAFYLIRTNYETCQVYQMQRWIEYLRQLLRETRLRRDDALQAGEFSSADPWAINEQVNQIRSFLESAEDVFEHYRLDCAGTTARQQSSQAPVSAGQRSNSPIVTIDPAALEAKSGLNIESYLGKTPDNSQAPACTTEQLHLGACGVERPGASCSDEQRFLGTCINNRWGVPCPNGARNCDNGQGGPLPPGNPFEGAGEQGQNQPNPGDQPNNQQPHD